MDPLSALSVASSVIQFVQFGGSLVAKSHEIYTSGSLRSNIDYEEATQRLSSLTNGVKSSLNDLEGLGPLSKNSTAIKAICVKCSSLANDLSARVNGLRIDKNQKGRKWKSFRQAIKSVYSKEVVDGLARDLRTCRDELNSHLLLPIE